LAGIAVVAGHNWSIFLRFEGGAGTITTLGVLVAMNVYAGAILIAMAVTVLIASRTASVASITVAVAMGFVLIVFSVLGITPWPYVLFGAIAGAFTIYALRPNIKRLMSGTERKLKTNH
jgi:glycerol-3-phosphate acyltransferase PlsY